LSSEDEERDLPTTRCGIFCQFCSVPHPSDRQVARPAFANPGEG